MLVFSLKLNAQSTTDSLKDNIECTLNIDREENCINVILKVTNPLDKAIYFPLNDWDMFQNDCNIFSVKKIEGYNQVITPLQYSETESINPITYIEIKPNSTIFLYLKCNLLTRTKKIQLDLNYFLLIDKNKEKKFFREITNVEANNTIINGYYFMNFCYAISMKRNGKIVIKKSK